jgi:ABC-type nickel/cobalt efflux system permease component RcnA
MYKIEKESQFEDVGTSRVYTFLLLHSYGPGWSRSCMGTIRSAAKPNSTQFVVNSTAVLYDRTVITVVCMNIMRTTVPARAVAMAKRQHSLSLASTFLKPFTQREWCSHAQWVDCVPIHLLNHIKYSMNLHEIWHCMHSIPNVGGWI